MYPKGHTAKFMTKIRMISDFWGFWIGQKWLPEKNNHKALLKFLRFIWTCKTSINVQVDSNVNDISRNAEIGNYNFNAFVAIGHWHRKYKFSRKNNQEFSNNLEKASSEEVLQRKLKRNQIKGWKIEVLKSFWEDRTSFIWVSWTGSSQNFSNFFLGSGRRILFCLLILAQISPKKMSKITEKRLSSDLENYYLFDLSWKSCQFSPITNQSIKATNSGP